MSDMLNEIIKGSVTFHKNAATLYHMESVRFLALAKSHEQTAKKNEDKLAS